MVNLMTEQRLFADYKEVLTQEQVTTLYNTAITVKPSTDLYLTQECYAEIDRWDGGVSQAQLWIKVPYISKA